MKLKTAFCLMFIFMNYFFNCKASLERGLYAEHPQFVKMVGAMIGISSACGFTANITDRSDKKINLFDTCTFGFQALCIPNDFKDMKKKEIWIRGVLITALGYLLFQSYNNNLDGRRIVLTLFFSRYFINPVALL